PVDRLASFVGGSDLMHHRDPGGMAARNEGDGVAPEKRRDRDPFFNADSKLGVESLRSRDREEEIDAEWLRGHGPGQPDLRPDKIGRLKGHREHAEAARIADRGHQFRARQAPNWRLHDWMPYPQLPSQPGREHLGTLPAVLGVAR